MFNYVISVNDKLNNAYLVDPNYYEVAGFAAKQIRVFSKPELA